MCHLINCTHVQSGAKKLHLSYIQQISTEVNFQLKGIIIH